MHGKAWTVLGPIEPSQLGITITHEHLLIDEVPVYFQLPEQATQRMLSRHPVTLDILGWLRFNPDFNEDNLRLDDEDMMAEEIIRFRLAEGRTIVDATSVGLGRDAAGLRRLSLRTGINLITGSGYYVAASHPPDMESKDVDDIQDEIVKDIRLGIQDTGVRAGLIGEIGTTFPWTPNEQKVLRGAARAQLETGAPMEVHPGTNRKMRFVLIGTSSLSHSLEMMASYSCLASWSCFARSLQILPFLVISVIPAIRSCSISFASPTSAASGTKLRSISEGSMSI